MVRKIYYKKVPDIYKKISFDDIIGDYIANTKKAVQNFLTVRKNIFIYGDVGTGKTALLWCLVNEIYKNHSTTKNYKTLQTMPYEFIEPRPEFKFSFVTSVDLIESLRARFKRDCKLEEWEKDCYDSAKMSKILLLDELGLQYGTEREHIEFFNLFNYRYENRLPTIATSNITPKQIQEKLGKRIYDRFFSDCQIFKLEGDSMRWK